MIKIAIVGCGQIADAHIQEARKIPDVNIAAVCDLNRHMARQAALRFNISACFTDVGMMLKETRPDVVHITTPPASHLPIAKAALGYGSHVYIEKPFSVDLSEAEEIVMTAGQVGRLVCVGHNSTFDPAYQRLLQLHSDGKLGEISHLESAMGYNLKGPFGLVSMGDPHHWLHKLPGGLAQNNISHPISLILGLMPGRSIKVKAVGYRFREERYDDVRDTFFDEIRAALVCGRTTANLVFSCRSRPVQTFITAYGTKCAANASLDARTLRVTNGANMPGPFAKIQWAGYDAREATREFYNNCKNMLYARLHYFEGMRELFRHFYRAVEGKQEMPIPMSEALRVTAVMDDIIRECKSNDVTGSKEDNII